MENQLENLEENVAKKEVFTMAPEQTPAPDKVLLMGLDEFLRKLSQTDKRVEMLGGFHFWAKSKGVQKATETEFTELFTQFSTMKV